MLRRHLCFNIPDRDGRSAAVAAALLAVLLAGCGEVKVDDPILALTSPDKGPRVHKAAIAMAAADGISDDELKVLRGMVHRPGYTNANRERAVDVLAESHKDPLLATIDLNLPQISSLPWRRRLCEIIAERGWTELTPALGRAWAIPIHGWVETPQDRPEFKALAALHGEDRVVDVLFGIVRDEKTVAKQGLRTTLWQLLHQLGERDRLASLLSETAVDPDDSLMVDLRAASTELGIVPATKEEILWIRKLRESERELLWKQAAVVVQHLASDRRRELELRDIPILVAVANHEPELLRASKDELYDMVESHLRTTSRHLNSSSYDGYLGTNNQRLHDHRERLTWGDLAAMLMAVRAMQVPEVIDHLFDYAERDRLDESTEYGGVIRLDDQHRFEILEFPPRVRYHDLRFEAPQAMFDAGYGGVFHFHLHAQDYENDRYAGPGFGDFNYADGTRANCLVMTFIDDNTLNLDYYRHGRVVVDLGEIRKGE